MDKNIFLIGFMGAGKSAIGKKIASNFNMEFIDMDDYIVNSENRSIDSIFSEYGEEKFREIENLTLQKLIRKQNAVISTGGGIIENIGNRKILLENLTIYIYSPFNDIWNRISNDSKRPLVKKGYEYIKNLYEKREAIYRETGITIDTSKLSVTKSADKIINFIENSK